MDPEREMCRLRIRWLDQRLRGGPIDHRCGLPFERVEERGSDVADDSHDLAPGVFLQANPLADGCVASPNNCVAASALSTTSGTSLRGIAPIEASAGDEGNGQGVEIGGSHTRRAHAGRDGDRRR